MSLRLYKAVALLLLGIVVALMLWCLSRRRES